MTRQSDVSKTSHPTGPLRILHVITGLNTGGAETFLCRLLESLRLPAFEHTVVSLLAPGPLSERVGRSATLHHLGMRRGRAGLAAFVQLRRFLRDSGPDIIHGWMYHADLMTTFAAIGSRVPVVWGIRQSLYELGQEKPTTRLVIRTCSLLSRLPSRIIYNSATGAAQHTEFGFSSRRTMVIPNGFDTEKFAPDSAARERVRMELGIASDEVAIGLVARVHPMKDHANFLRAAGYFAVSRPRSVFVLVGDGAVRENRQLVEIIERLNLKARVRLCGRRTDIAAVDNALDIASSSSSWGEGFSNALAETMACGTPCVTTEVGDAREIVADTGILVAPRDPAALCAGWEKLAGMDQTERHKLGLRARQRIIERYSLTVMAGQYASLYSEVTGKS